VDKDNVVIRRQLVPAPVVLTVISISGRQAKNVETGYKEDDTGEDCLVFGTGQ
jgi:hypothetical protein